jgi:class 3 adenylate cyclase
VSSRERKAVTVLFADLVGFTSASLRYDLEPWGGTVEEFSQRAWPTASRLARLCPLRKTSM